MDLETCIPVTDGIDQENLFRVIYRGDLVVTASATAWFGDTLIQQSFLKSANIAELTL